MALQPEFVLYYRAKMAGQFNAVWIRGGRYATYQEAHDIGTAWKVATLLRGGADTQPAYKVVRVAGAVSQAVP